MNKIEKLKKFLNTHLITFTWDYSGYKANTFPTDFPQNDWNQTIITRINQTSATIFKDTYKGGATTILIPEDKEILELFESLLYFQKEVVESDNGSYKFGSLSGRYTVYVIPGLTTVYVDTVGSYDVSKIYVCKLENPLDDVFDVKKYSRVGVIKIDFPNPLEDDK